MDLDYVGLPGTLKSKFLCLHICKGITSMCPRKCLYLSKLLMASTKTDPKSREPRVEAAESFNNLYFTRCKHNDNMN